LVVQAVIVAAGPLSFGVRPLVTAGGEGKGSGADLTSDLPVGERMPDLAHLRTWFAAAASGYIKASLGGSVR